MIDIFRKSPLLAGNNDLSETCFWCREAPLQRQLSCKMLSFSSVTRGLLCPCAA